MKKAILTISLTVILAIGAFAQEQPKPAKDTVNMDTNAKPEFYYAVEDDKANNPDTHKSTTLIISVIAGAIIIVGAAAFVFLRKKK